MRVRARSDFGPSTPLFALHHDHRLLFPLVLDVPDSRVRSQPMYPRVCQKSGTLNVPDGRVIRRGDERVGFFRVPSTSGEFTDVSTVEIHQHQFD